MANAFLGVMTYVLKSAARSALSFARTGLNAITPSYDVY